jgi:tRNA pseudouridine55 synthase
VGGHLTALRRTRVGPFGLAEAATLDDLAVDLTVLPVADAARALFPVRALDAGEVVELGFGRRLPAEPGSGERPVVAAIAPDGHLVALLAERGGTARPLVVFAPS